jgi:putative ABC transport system permease protein
MSWLRRLANTFRTGRVRRDIDRELSFHLAEREDALHAGGLSADEARRQARLQFGHPPLQLERTRDVDVATAVDASVRHLRYALRALRRAPGFTLTVVLTLALGIGANAAVFSALNAVLLRALPYAAPDRLVEVTQFADNVGVTPTAAARLTDWRRMNSTFTALTGHYTQDVSDVTGNVPERVRRATVLPGFLTAWGVVPLHGRDFTDAEHRLGGPFTVMVSERYWRERLGGAADVLTRSVRTDDRSFAVIAVLPASFTFTDPDVDWWAPEFVNAPWAQSRPFRSSTGIGRLKSGVSVEQARADLERAQSRLAAQYPDTDRTIRPVVVALKESVVGASRDSLWLLFGAVSVLLLIACTNISSLLLSRGAQRRNEIAVRYSLGASRGSVLAQLLTEVTLLALAGGVAGLTVAAAAPAALRALVPDLPRLDEIALDSRVVAYTLAASLIVVVLCGVLPAIRSARPGLAGRGEVSHRHALQWALVGVQVALAVMLLSGAGLLLRSIDALGRIDPGFDAARVLTFRVSGSYAETRDYAGVIRRINRTLDAVAALPGIDAAATTTNLPGLPGAGQEGTAGQAAGAVEVRLAQTQGDRSSPLVADMRTVSPGYFESLRIPLLAGQLCRRVDGPQGSTEVLVNRSFVTRYLQGRSPIGLHFAGARPDRIVGVVGDARESGIDRDPGPVVYPCSSAPTPFPWFIVRTSAEPDAMAAVVRRTINELEPTRSVYDMMALDRRIDDAYAQNRLRTIGLTLFAVSALALACRPPAVGNAVRRHLVGSRHARRCGRGDRRCCGSGGADSGGASGTAAADAHPEGRVTRSDARRQHRSRTAGRFQPLDHSRVVAQ